MTLLELHNKFKKTGIGNNPVITDEELRQYSEKLSEMVDFFEVPGIVSMGLLNIHSQVEHMRSARANHARHQYAKKG